jgi:hypothetical protein
MPSGAIEDQHGVRALGDMARYLVEMQLHRAGVGERQRQRCPFAVGWTDRAEQIGIRVALIGGLTRPRSTPRPLTNDAVLLADAGFVLPPDFDGFAFRQVGQMRLQRARKVFLYAAMTLAS